MTFLAISHVSVIFTQVCHRSGQTRAHVWPFTKLKSAKKLRNTAL